MLNSLKFLFKLEQKLEANIHLWTYKIEGDLPIVTRSQKKDLKNLIEDTFGCSLDVTPAKSSAFFVYSKQGFYTNLYFLSKPEFEQFLKKEVEYSKNKIISLNSKIETLTPFLESI